jgi:hypothetical protein
VHVKVTIELSGEHTDLSPILAELSRVLSPDMLVSEAEPASWWSEDRARTFVHELKLPALVALQVIADGAPKARVAAVQHELKRLGFRMTPGALSSIGFASRRLNAPAPFSRDNYQGVYVMDSEVAAVIQGAVKEELDRRAAQ